MTYITCNHASTCIIHDYCYFHSLQIWLSFGLHKICTIATTMNFHSNQSWSNTSASRWSSGRPSWIHHLDWGNNVNAHYSPASWGKYLHYRGSDIGHNSAVNKFINTTNPHGLSSVLYWLNFPKWIAGKPKKLWVFIDILFYSQKEDFIDAYIYTFNKISIIFFT